MGAARAGELFDLTGQVALVTGASKGLGRAMAVGLAKAGASVALCARDLALHRAGARPGDDVTILAIRRTAPGA